MKIIVDMMGGDNAPLAVLEGVAQAVKEYGITVVGVGDEALVRRTAQENSIPLDGDRKSTRLNSSHNRESRMPSSA